MSTLPHNVTEPESPSAFRAEIEKVDGVLLDTLGRKGSMLTGGLTGAGVGLALAAVPGAAIGFLIGVGLGKLGTGARS